MLKSLLVRNLAVATECELTLHAGMTVLTGETGAGKSVLVNAIGLILGNRAENHLVRSGTKQALVVAEFDLTSHKDARAALDEQAIEHDGTCLIRRQIFADGGSKAFCNDTPITLKALHRITSHLVAIHGQHQHYELANRDAQRELLDQFGGLQSQAEEVFRLAQRYREVNARITALTEGDQNRADREAFLKFQLEELETLAIDKAGYEELDRRHRQLAHGNELIEGCESALESLEARSAIESVVPQLQTLEKFETKLAEARELILSGVASVDEARRTIEAVRDHIDLSEEEYAEIDARLAKLHEAARKHRVKPDELSDLVTRLSDELQSLSNREQAILELEQERAALEGQFDSAAAELSKGRQASATKLASTVTSRIADLGMADAHFAIELRAIEATTPTPHGREEIVFTSATNKGQASRPLAKIASGGELSRISLAIQSATTQLTGIPVLVYDEVDTGIGGRVAELVGRRLRETSQTRQVFCVTHLPQVASLANHHFRITKTAASDTTEISVEKLSEEERIDELARMLAGIEISDQSRRHAEEMLERAAATG